MARAKRTPPKRILFPRTHTLSQDDNRVLDRLSQDASDRLGWTVGHSAVVRALLRYVAQQPSSWATTTLHPLIEEEISAGTVWGSKQK